MCFTNTPASIKVVAAFCFCINMFNLIYLFMRYNELLPKDAERIRRDIESVMPDVKNLDKYMTPRHGTILVSSLAGISILFDFVLFVGVDYEQPSMILSAWMWGVIDCSFDFAIGIASANMTFMDALAMAPENVEVTEAIEKSLNEYRKMMRTSEPEQPASPTSTETRGPPAGNATEYAMAPATVAPKNDHDAHRLRAEQLTLLLLYVLFRLSFKVVALAGIKDFASHVIAVRQHRDYATSSMPDHSASSARLEERSGASSMLVISADMAPTGAPSGTLPPVVGPPPASHVPPATSEPTPAQPHLGITPIAPSLPGFLPAASLPTPVQPHLGINPVSPPPPGILPDITPTRPRQDFPVPPVPPQQPPYPVHNPVRPP